MCQATYNGLKEQTGKRPFVITRACYAGTQKYSTVWTGEKVEGKQYILKDAPIDVCPMYIKAGSIIPTYEVVQYVGELTKEMLHEGYPVYEEITSVVLGK